MAPRPERVLLIFVDGLGIGRRDPEVNPLARLDGGVFAAFTGEPQPEIYGEGRVRATDCRLSVAGLPQSATGQSALLTGCNAAELVGGHVSGLPTRTLKGLLARESVFVKLRARARTATFANAYQPAFFENTPRWISATTVAVMAASVRLRTLDDLAAGEAVYHDFTHRRLRELGHDLPLRTPEEAGANLARLAGAHDFTLYEYFLTDRAGHARDMDGAVVHLAELERFVRAVVDRIDRTRQLVLLTSDHGNIEDLSHGRHTLNPVPTLAWGSGAAAALERIGGIQDVTPAILAALGAAA